MANQSAKNNQKRNEGRIKYLQWATLGITIWYFVIEFFTGSLFSIWGFLIALVLGGLNYFCYKQIVKSWDFQLPPEAYEYFIDVLALNLFAMFLSPITSYAW